MILKTLAAQICRYSTHPNKNDKRAHPVKTAKELKDSAIFTSLTFTEYKKIMKKFHEKRIANMQVEYFFILFFLFTYVVLFFD